MSVFRVRYRFLDKDTGNVISSAQNFMTTITKDGTIAMYHTKAKKLVCTSKTDHLILQVATRKHDGKWVWETIDGSKDTESLSFKIKRLLKTLNHKLIVFYFRYMKTN